MLGLLLELLTFLLEHFRLLTSLAALTAIFILLAKSIKRHAGMYYFVFAVPAILFLVRQVGALAGVEIFHFSRTSVMGEVMREYVHMSGFAWPLLIIIMFVGALPAQNKYVKRIMMIRKELSIISGFPVLIHSWVRIKQVPGSIDFFTEEGSLGAGILHAGYLLGVLMLVLFIVLWITSFDSIHKRLGAVKWKKIQKWSYALYALLFLHSMCLGVGRLLGAGGGHGRVEEMTLTNITGIISTCLVFGSYLILRLRKRKKILPFPCTP